MSEAEFIYNGVPTIIQCKPDDKMKLVCQKFKDKAKIDQNNIFYSYDGKVGLNEEFKPELFVESCEDYSKPCDVQYKNTTDNKLNTKEGNYRLEIVVSDTLGNKTYKTVNLTVKKGYSLEDELMSDTRLDHIDPEFDDFEETYFIKFDKAMEEHDMLESEDYELLLECMDKGWRKYLPELYKLNRIDEESIITVYNKYDYVIGFVVRIKLDNKKVLFLTKE